MKHILAQQLAAGEASFFLICNYFLTARCLHSSTNNVSSFPKSLLFNITELFIKVMELFVHSGHCHALPVCMSTHKRLSHSSVPRWLLLIWPLPEHRDCFLIRAVPGLREPRGLTQIVWQCYVTKLCIKSLSIPSNWEVLLILKDTCKIQQ